MENDAFVYKTAETQGSHYIDILPFLCYNNVQFVYLQIKKGKSLCFIIFYS